MSKIVNKIEHLIYKASVKVFLRNMMQHHADAVVGLENLPEKGPYIIIANHESFVDHFFTGSVNHYLFRQKIYFLTKKESFESFHSRVWHNATGCLPIDRDKPDINSFRQIFKVLELGNIIVIYPEGTRGAGDKLLPFKVGAFRIASRMGVPIIPAAIVESRYVMPKGARWFKNAKAKILYGKPFSVEQIKDLGVDKLMDLSKGVIDNLLERMKSPVFIEESRKSSATYLANMAREKVETILTNKTSRYDKYELENISDILHVAQINDSNNLDVRVLRARVLGLKLLSNGGFFFIRHIWELPKMVKLIFEVDPNHPFGHYIFGQFYMNIPWLIGGNINKSIDYLEKAYKTASLYNIDQSAFAVTYAKALKKGGKLIEAYEILGNVVNMQPEEHNIRLLRRQKNAQELMQKIKI